MSALGELIPRMTPDKFARIFTDHARIATTFLARSTSLLRLYIGEANLVPEHGSGRDERFMDGFWAELDRLRW